MYKRQAKERVTFGKPIIEHQAVSFRLADMATQIDAARLMVWRAATFKDAGKPCLKAVSYTHLDVYKRQGLHLVR